MKKLLVAVSFLFFAFFGFSQTQAEMNDSTIGEYVKADKKLNDIYNQLLKEYKDDKAFFINLKTAQRLWIQFRDAEVNMMYPEKEPNYYGSMHPFCLYTYKKKLTEERINTLNKWLKEVEEGESCTSSIKSVQ